MKEGNTPAVTLIKGAHAAVREGAMISLRRKEYELLEFLIRNRRRLLNRLTILEYVWDNGTTAFTNTLEVHMASLRRKIDGGYSRKLINNVRGAGYIME
jgi:two-component system OmpR family response regulator